LTASAAKDLLAGSVSVPSQGRERLKTPFHIDVDDKAVAERLLDRVQIILTTHADQAIQVGVVANAAGLNLLRADTSVVSDRVRTMMSMYDNLVFAACANTIQRMKEQGVDVPLIDRTHASETAVDHVVDRLREGWTYAKL
jgi:intracellular sulfur oxidation DsrE/DsrF family protein